MPRLRIAAKDEASQEVIEMTRGAPQPLADLNRDPRSVLETDTHYPRPRGRPKCAVKMGKATPRSFAIWRIVRSAVGARSATRIINARAQSVMVLRGTQKP
jgi:hypothetical protein